MKKEMERLLLFHYDGVEILDSGDEFEEQLLEAINALCKKYLKKSKKGERLYQNGQCVLV